MGCASGIVRCILILFNTLMTLLSLVCVGIGIFVVVSANAFFNLLTQANNQINNNPDQVTEEIKRIAEQSDIVRATGFVLIGLGAFVLLISVLGCFGACKESKCLLVTYATFIGLLAAAKIALVVIAIIHQPNLESLAKKGLKELQDKYFVSVNEIANVSSPTDARAGVPKELKTVVTQLINYMQVALDCCGAVTNKDIASSPSWLASNRIWDEEKRNMTVPATCCPIKDDKKADLLGHYKFPQIKDYLKDVNCPVSGQGVHEKLCYKAAVDLVNVYLWISIGSFGGLILLELLLIIFSFCVVCSARDEKIKRNY